MMKKIVFTPALVLMSLITFGQSIIISEIHYNPADAGTTLSDDLEFIEITNVTANAIDITGYSFVSGITFVFGSSTTIAAGQSLVIAKNKGVFDISSGKVASGQYIGSLKNSGEKITFTDALLTTVFEVTYGQISPWPVLADGLGSSLELVNPLAPDAPESWVSSKNLGGSPGSYSKTQTTISFPVVVNEVLANTLGDEKIEIYNSGNSAINIGYWYLTDDRKTPEKYQFPANTMLAAKEYKVISSSEYSTAFSLSSKGEDVYIFSADANDLTGYSNGFEYTVSDVEQSFGLHTASDGKTQKFNQTNQTFGSANSAPIVGPLVITDIMYNPGFGYDEFIIIKNTSAQDVSTNSSFLVDSNSIRITGIDYKFDFRDPKIIPAGKSVVFTLLDPESFRAKYLLAADVQIFQYSNILSKNNELIEIQIPIYRDTLLDGSYDNHFKTLDEVWYNDAAPWPTDADGLGKYLYRNAGNIYANDPAEWKAVDYKLLTATSSLSDVSALELYPTVAKNNIYVTSNNFDTYKIFNTLGIEIINGKTQESIDVTSLEQGNYTIVFANDFGTKTLRFIKE